ncbi:faciogenital dysplasia protein [Anaeramoeba flamelloides]|uniref:Faciogenital dysplasia protein n=1 Tax=Anaeramoeba flamelloides TaxID=1746091 RepID=A0ABQ8Y6Z0_9EUKA|nr:faciogenital dysplasia protein [Anaeramoeba flamelloides]
MSEEKTQLTQEEILEKKNRRIQQKFNVTYEILETERNYVGGLRILKTLFIEPLEDFIKTNKPIITKNDIKIIFSDISVILSFHEILLSDFEKIVDEEKMQQIPNTSVAQVFQKNLKWMNFHGSYANQYPKSLLQIKTCRKQKKFRNFIKKQETNKNCKRLGIEDFLVSPLQRIPRYKLLLERLLKYTDENTEEFPNLKEVFDQICKTATRINEKKRDAENSFRVFEISESLINDRGEDINIFQWYRRIVHEGPLTRMINKGKKKQLFMVFLFNDFLLLTKIRKSLTLGRIKYRVKRMHPLSEVSQVSNVSEQPTLFKLHTHTHKYTFEAKDKDEKKKWIESIKKSQKDLKTISDSRLQPHLQKQSKNLIQQIGRMYSDPNLENDENNNVEANHNEKQVNQTTKNENEKSTTTGNENEKQNKKKNEAKTNLKGKGENKPRVRKFARLRMAQNSSFSGGSLGYNFNFQPKINQTSTSMSGSKTLKPTSSSNSSETKPQTKTKSKSKNKSISDIKTKSKSKSKSKNKSISDLKSKSTSKPKSKSNSNGKKRVVHKKRRIKVNKTLPSALNLDKTKKKKF